VDWDTGEIIVTASLPEGLQEVWDALSGRELSAKQLSVALAGNPSVDAMRKRIQEIRATGRRIETRPGGGYFRPDAPPPSSASA
jgi:biotin operon repressor